MTLFKAGGAVAAGTVAVLMGLNVPAKAASLSYTEGPSNYSGSLAYATTITVNGFNTNIGTLTGVDLIVTAAVSGSITVINLTGSAQNFSSAGLSVPITVSDPFGTTASLLATPSTSGTAAASPNFASFTYVGTPFSVSSASASVTQAVASGAIANWAGTHATIDLTLAAPLNIFGDNFPVGLAVGVGSGSVNGTVSVEYFYTNTTPEPASLALLGSGLVFVGLARRRRNRPA